MSKKAIAALAAAQTQLATAATKLAIISDLTNSGSATPANVKKIIAAANAVAKAVDNAKVKTTAAQAVLTPAAAATGTTGTKPAAAKPAPVAAAKTPKAAKQVKEEKKSRSKPKEEKKSSSSNKK